MKTLFILNGAPYGSEATYNGLRFAAALGRRCIATSSAYRNRLPHRPPWRKRCCGVASSTCLLHYRHVPHHAT